MDWDLTLEDLDGDDSWVENWNSLPKDLRRLKVTPDLSLILKDVLGRRFGVPFTAPSTPLLTVRSTKVPSPSQTRKVVPRWTLISSLSTRHRSWFRFPSLSTSWIVFSTDLVDTHGRSVISSCRGVFGLLVVQRRGFLWSRRDGEDLTLSWVCGWTSPRTFTCLPTL